MFATDRRAASTANILHQATIRGRRPQVLLPNAQTSSPLTWWRTREPWSFIDRRAGSSQLLTQVRTLPICDPDWRTAAHGDASAAIAVAIRQMQKHVISAPEIDFALAAVLACALVGADSDEAAPLIRFDRAPGFRDDLAPGPRLCWRIFVIPSRVVSSFPGLLSSQTVAGKIDAMRVMHEAVEDRVGVSWIANDLVPG